MNFHALKVTAKQRETQDSLRISLDVPTELREEYAFSAGQHLPVQIERNGKKLRRTYSICSPPGSWPLQIGVRIQPGGQFSTFAADELCEGDSLLVMPPTGRFHATPNADNAKHYLGVAAGSGITPILSILASLLGNEPASRATLFYGNRTQRSTMFIDDLFALKNRFTDRLQLHFLFSREEQEFDIAAGRLDADKMSELLDAFCGERMPDAAYVCGPDTLIDNVTDALLAAGMASSAVHSERFGALRKAKDALVADAASRVEMAEVTVVMDGHRKSFRMSKSGSNIVDAAAEQGVELPYSCKGGVCATCRTHVSAGEVKMSTNYGLEPWEVEKGFVLACQSVPSSDAVLLDYDKT